MDLELARLVAEDLDYLFKASNQDIADASLRRSSPVLRALLVEGLWVALRIKSAVRYV